MNLLDRMGADTSVVKGKTEEIHCAGQQKHCPRSDLSNRGWIGDLSLCKVDTYGLCPVYCHQDNKICVPKIITPVDCRIFTHCAVDTTGNVPTDLDDDDDFFEINVSLIY